MAANSKNLFFFIPIINVYFMFLKTYNISSRITNPLIGSGMTKTGTLPLVFTTAKLANSHWNGAAKQVFLTIIIQS